MQQKTLMVFGIGKLGGPVVDVLSARHAHHRFVFVSRSKERSERRANLSKYLSAQWSQFPEVVGEETDLLDTSKTAELLSRYKPDVVFNATTPFPWWKIERLPERERDLANHAGPGMWCALDCLLPLLLTQALEASGTKCTHVNGCYPDMTNTFLSQEASSPKLGIGNVSNLVPGLQLAFADRLQCPAADVGVQIVGHHYVSWNAPSPKGCPDAPYHLTITHPKGQLQFVGPDDTPFKELRSRASRTRGLEGLGVTIGSASALLDELLGGHRRRHHSPGACGLPGGYPITLDPSGNPSLDLPLDLVPRDAVDMNARAQRFDGVAEVRPGAVLATEIARNAHKEIVGCELPEVRRDQVKEIAADTVARLEAKYQLGLLAA